jgi:NADH dehydrogenase
MSYTISAEPSPVRPRVVVVGAGFGGLRTVERLARTGAEVILVDRRNHHLFQPLLYQVATAALSPADIATPIRAVVRDHPNVHVVMGEVTSVDLESRHLRWGDQEIGYDWLVLAAGATHTYFGNDQWEERAPGLKTLDDAIDIRRRVLLAFEEAELEDDEAARRAKLTFVVVGGGPTGVELAGALREIAAQTIPQDFRRVDTSTARIILVEGADRLLPAMSGSASRHALKDLERLGVEVRLGTLVTEVDDRGVRAGEEHIPAANVIWAAGVKAAPVSSTLDAPLDRAGRVQVAPDCSVPGHPEVFVIGDMASQVSADTGEPVPGVAQGAIQMGSFVGELIADEIEAEERGEPRPERPAFRYRDRGNMATIGRARAVADVGGLTLTGLPAWLLWSLVHVAFLIGYRSKLLVMINWAWQWLIHSRGARLITGRPSVKVERPVNLSRRNAA